MEMSWAEQQMPRFLMEARQIMRYLFDDEPDDFFVERAVNFVHSFLSAPTDTPQYAESLLAVADLANFLHYHMHHRGMWSELIHILTILVVHLERMQFWEFCALHTERIAVLTNHQQGPQSASLLYQRVLEMPVFDRLPLFLRIDMWHQYSICLIDLGEYSVAKSYLQKGLALCKQYEALHFRQKLMNHPDIHTKVAGTFWQLHGFILNLLGNIALMLGQYDQAHNYYEESARVFRKYDTNEAFAYSANQSLGRLWLYRQEHAKALPYLLRNYELNRRQSKVQGDTASACYLAAAYIGLHQLDEAERLLNSAMQGYQQLQDAAGLAMCHLYFGELECARGNRKKAIAQWRRVLDILGSTQSYMIEQQSLAHLMVHHLRAGQIADSLDAFARLLKCLKRQHIEPYDVCGVVTF